MYGRSTCNRLAGAALATALLWSGQALADDGEAQTPDAAAGDVLMLGAAVAVSELDGERGTAGIALNITDVEQNVTNTIDIDSGGGDVVNTNGNVMIADGARTGNFSITAINTGNNVAMSPVFAVNLYFE